MANYTAPLLNASILTTYRSAGALYVATSTVTQRRIQVYEIEFGQAGSLNSSDVQVQWDVSRFTSTAALAGASVAPNPMDAGDTASYNNYFNNITTEPTNVAAAGAGLSLKNWAINQRGSYRWRALDDGDNIVIPLSAGALQQGIVVRALTSAATSNQSAIGNISFVER